MIGWSKELEVGNETIDNQHKILIHTLENVYIACSRGEGLKQLSKTIEYLLGYVEVHFREEEDLQRKYDYPDYERHKIIHEAYKANIKKLVKKNPREEYTTHDLAELMKQMIHMITQHILKDDINIARYIKGERIKRQSNLVYTGGTDRLTGLMDEAALYAKIEKSLDEEKEKKFVYIGINIHGFNQLNYSYGLDIGDEILMYIAGCLQIYSSKSLAIGRVYGDKFGLFMEQTGDFEEIMQEVRYIKENIELGFRRRGAIVSLALCVGVICYPDEVKDLKEIRQAINIAINESKSIEGHPIVVFEECLKDKIMRKTKILKLIQNYELSKYLKVVYQPICEASTGNIKGCEALLRLVDEEGKVISPVEFIPLAEESNLINELTYFCIREVGEMLQEVPEDKLDYISVNLSPHQFEDPKFLKYMEALTSTDKLDMKRMFFEITETAIVNNFEVVTECLRELREMGSEIMIDDFGQAYSSLSYLGRMQVDAIKVDKSFLDDICCNENAKIILKAIVNLAHEIGLRVVVEGVETQEQWDILKEIKVERLQGFLFSQPIEKEELLQKLLG